MKLGKWFVILISAVLLLLIGVTVGLASQEAQSQETVYVTDRNTNVVKPIDPETYEVGPSIAVGGTPIQAIASPDGSRVYVVNAAIGTRYISVIETGTSAVVENINVGLEPNYMVISLDGSRGYVLVWGGAGGPTPGSYIMVIDTDPCSPTYHDILYSIRLLDFGIGSLTESMTVSPDGRFLYVMEWAQPSAVLVIDTTTSTLSDRIELSGCCPGEIVVTPDGSRLYAQHDHASYGKVSAIDLATGDITLIHVGGGGGQGVSITPDGSRIYVPQNRWLKVIDTATNQVTGIWFRSGVGSLQRIAFNYAGSRAYASSILDSQGFVIVFDTDPTSPNYHTVISAIGVGYRTFGITVAASGPGGPPPDAICQVAPDLAVDFEEVTVGEGQTATNTGTVSDPDGDDVTLTASVGTVTNNGDGTWSWSFPTTDGPANSQEVTITGDDGNGGTDEVTFSLTVNNVAPSVDAVHVPLEPVQLGTPVYATAEFSDPGDDAPYSATFNYGDGSGDQAAKSVTNNTCTGPDYEYASPGVYTVSVTVTDKDGDFGSAEATEYIVIYDPTGGFITGGGWIISPPGAYSADPDLTGKANFGFVSKYKKGASEPTGNTEFQFKSGDLNFHSDSYEWLVVTGSDHAMFKGSGTINGVGDYKFMLWASDDDPDTFRIKIWEEDEFGNETVTYDNVVDQAIAGGNIAIHTK
jgi:YVTN family beta-propeller protein